MATTKDDFEKSGATAQLHKIRITLTSRNVSNLEKCEFGCAGNGGIMC
jgi:hypothetical protein